MSQYWGTILSGEKDWGGDSTAEKPPLDEQPGLTHQGREPRPWGRSPLQVLDGNASHLRKGLREQERTLSPTGRRGPQVFSLSLLHQLQHLAPSSVRPQVARGLGLLSQETVALRPQRPSATCLPEGAASRPAQPGLCGKGWKEPCAHGAALSFP